MVQWYVIPYAPFVLRLILETQLPSVIANLKALVHQLPIGFTNQSGKSDSDLT